MEENNIYKFLFLMCDTLHNKTALLLLLLLLSKTVLLLLSWLLLVIP